MPHVRRTFLWSALMGTALIGVVATRSIVFAATTPDQDFAARCAAPGVLVCQGFDEAQTFVYTPGQKQGLYPMYSTGQIRGFQDTAIKASGASSLRFDIEGLTSADNSGSFQWNFGKTFSQNSTFYVQYQARFDDTFVNTNWNTLVHSDPKLSILYDANGLSCANIELTTVEWYSADIPDMYSQCGARSLETSPTNITSWVPVSQKPKLLQQGSSLTSGYNCLYGQYVTGTGNGTGCFKYIANTWITFYYKVSVGTWGQPNSSIQAFVSINGGPYLQFVNVSDYILIPDGSTSGGFSRIMLTLYMTGKNATVNHPTAHAWFDELIVSTDPIASPGAATVRPDPPTNLQVQ